MLVTETGCPVCDEAFLRMKTHIVRYKDFQSFKSALLLEMGRVPVEKQRDALLMVLFSYEKNSAEGYGAKFEELLGSVDEGKAEELKRFVIDSLTKVRK